MTSREAWNMLLAFTGGDEETAVHVIRLVGNIDQAFVAEGVAVVGGEQYEAAWAWNHSAPETDWDTN
jgi:hypothetical protein